MSEETVIHCPIHSLYEITPCDLAEIAPLVTHLEANRPVTQQTTFPRGTVMEDGRLDLCKQQIGPLGCRLITEALASNTTISSLLLGTDGIGDAGAADVAKLIDSNEHLEIVYLGCNQIGEQGVTALAQSLEQNRSVRGLWLKRNPIGPRGFLSLATMLRHNRTLKTLDLVNTLPGPEELTALMDVLLHENRTVERLYLGGNAIGEEGAWQLADLLRANPVLKALLLNVNHLGDNGAVVLANALRENRTLTELGLGSNGIMSEGSMALFEAVRNHPSLTHLDMGYSPSTRVLGASANNIGDVGAEAVGTFLAENQNLLWLDLRHNGITDAGKAAILSGLEQNTTLHQILLNGKPDPKVMALLERNHALHPTHDLPSVRDVALIRSVYRTLVLPPH